MLHDKRKGYVIVNRNHPSNPKPNIYPETFRTTKKQCISDFTERSGEDWRVWYRKWKFRCVQAVSEVTSLD